MNATMLDHVDSYWLVAALTLAFAAAIVNGFRQLAGSSTPSERKRRPGQSATAWLLGDTMAARCRFDLPGYRIACTHTAAEPDEWDVTVPPPLSALAAAIDDEMYLPLGSKRYMEPPLTKQGTSVTA